MPCLMPESGNGKDVGHVKEDWTHYAATRSHVGVHSLCCHQGPQWCQWPMLWHGAMLMCVVCTATGDQAEVCGLC